MPLFFLILLGPQNVEQMINLTVTTVCLPRLTVDMACFIAKIKHSSFNPSEDMKEEPKFKTGGNLE